MLQQHFFTAWHSSSQQGKEIRHCIPLKKQWWYRFEECDLPRLELGDHLHNKLYSFNLHPCLTALLSLCLVPLCYGGRRLIPEALRCVGRAAPEAAVSQVSDCIQLLSAHGHRSYCIAWLDVSSDFPAMGNT